VKKPPAADEFVKIVAPERLTASSVTPTEFVFDSS